MNLRAILFDVYGTLLEVGPPPPDADTRWRNLFVDRLHIEPPFSRHEFSIASSRVIDRQHEAARSRGIPWPEVHWPSVVTDVVPELAELSQRDQEEFLYRQIQTGHSTRLNVQTPGLLRWLKEQRCLLGIISNAQAYTVRELDEALALHGLDRSLFVPNLCFWSFEHGFSKPDPHVFQILTARLRARGIIPLQALMVGDRLDNDIAPARVHGWHAWHLTQAAQPSTQTGGWSQLRSHLRGCVAGAPG